MSQSAAAAPDINIILPTPPRSSHFRLLYRGALSLPDTHLVLDGLTFVARVDTPSSTLLDSPLALALETMRGRPSLRWIGLTKLSSIFMDETGGITMDMHPDATLTRIYFENIFCLEPASCETGITVALGDTDGADVTRMVIFARAPSPSSNSTELQLVAARITPAPVPSTRLRLPRPDDPTPRRPPFQFLSRTSSSTSFGNAKKRTQSVPSSLRLGSPPGTLFKIPEMPPAGGSSSGSSSHMGDVMNDDDDDVFNAPAPVVENKGKRKREETEVENQIEKANKTIIKQSAMHMMPIPKTHPEYREIYGAVYKGVCFALRSDMKTTAVDLKVVERFVKAHTNMYTSKAP